VTRLLFEEGIDAIINADSISDGEFMFMSLTVIAKDFTTAEMWDKLRQKLLRMARLSSVRGLCNLAAATKVSCCHASPPCDEMLLGDCFEFFRPKHRCSGS
jgi:hypothetical protein